MAAYDVPYLGSPPASNPAVVAVVASAVGDDYYVLRANGVIDNYGTTSRGSFAISKALPEGSFASALAVDPATGGYYEAIDAVPLDGYLNPLRALTSLVPQEIDQGVDYCASGPIYALGDAVVANLYDSQWPSGVFISYRLTSDCADSLNSPSH